MTRSVRPDVFSRVFQAIRIPLSEMTPLCMLNCYHDSVSSAQYMKSGGMAHRLAEEIKDEEFNIGYYRDGIIKYHPAMAARRGWIPALPDQTPQGET